MSVKTSIAKHFIQVAEEQQRQLAPLSEDLALSSSGLDSLCFAIIVARLEDELGTDPFEAEDIQFPTTFGEFVGLYERASK